jgi:hypothetical protein
MAWKTISGAAIHRAKAWIHPNFSCCYYCYRVGHGEVSIVDSQTGFGARSVDYEEYVPKRHRACVVCWWGLAVVWVLVLCVGRHHKLYDFVHA